MLKKQQGVVFAAYGEGKTLVKHQYRPSPTPTAHPTSSHISARGPSHPLWSQFLGIFGRTKIIMEREGTKTKKVRPC
jgi:hypothetical protein